VKAFKASIQEASTEDISARIIAARGAAAGGHDDSDPTTQLMDDVEDLITLGMVSLEEVMQWPELQQMVKRLRQ